jgi:hypothetical protein
MVCVEELSRVNDEELCVVYIYSKTDQGCKLIIWRHLRPKVRYTLVRLAVIQCLRVYQLLSNHESTLQCEALASITSYRVHIIEG